MSSGAATGGPRARSGVSWVADPVAAAVAAGVAAAGAGWVVTGSSVAVPLASVGGLVVAAATVDATTARIPNGLVLAALAVVVGSWGLVGSVDGVAMRSLALDLLGGLLLSGAPAVFAVWLVAPASIGGGDWKLLAVGGLALGYLAPAAAFVFGVVGFMAAIGVAAVARRRTVALGPPLALGYAVALVVGLRFPEVVGGAVVGGR